METAPIEPSFSDMENLIFLRMNDEVISIMKETPSVKDIVDTTSGQTLLHVATKNYNLEVMSYLASADCDINAKDFSGWTPLMFAVKLGNRKPIQSLLSKNADVLITNSDGHNALQIYLSTLPCPIILRLFLKNLTSRCASNADLIVIITKAGCRLDHFIHLGNPELVRLFLEQQSHIDFHVASVSVNQCVEFSYGEILRVLLQYGVGVNQRRTLFFGISVTTWINSPKEMSEIFVETLLDSKFLDYNAVQFVDVLFRTAFEKVLNVIVKSKVNSYIKSEFGYEPVAYIFGNKRRGIFEFIKSEKININVCGRDGKTALHFAVQSNVIKNCSYLLKMGVDVNVIDDHGATPIFYAFSSRLKKNLDENCSTLLLKYGADFQACDSNGKTFIENVEYLVDYKDTFEIIFAHLAIVYSSQSLIKDSILKYINSHKSLSDFFKLRCKELERMKTDPLCGLLTSFTVLTNSDELISHHVKSFAEGVDQWLKDYSKTVEYYFYYYNVISDSIIKASIICNRRKKCVAFISDCIKILKPYDVEIVMDKICSFLTDSDLCKILEISK